jgi:hypothetical protein
LHRHRQVDVNAKFDEVKSLFSRPDGKMFATWSGQSLRALAKDVDHEEAYDTFYSHMSSFVHVDVRSANRFLRLTPDGPSWTQRASWHDVGEVLHEGASFLSCMLKLFGEQFDAWTATAVDECWNKDY